MKADQEFLIEHGWYKPEETFYSVRMYDDWGGPIQSELSVTRENISSAYSNIPLKIMAEFAREEGIEIDPLLETNANELLSADSILATLDSRIKSYVASTTNSKPEDWLKKDPLLNEVRHGHLHFSAQWRTGLKPRIKRGKRKRYEFDG